MHIKKYNIILVDDEEPALSGVEHGVNWNELEIDKVFKCHSMETALRMISSYSIDIVLTDIEMPNGTGLDLIRWIKNNKPNIKTVFYTGHANFEYVREALRLGASDYLLKPIPYDELEKIIDKLIKQLEAETQKDNAVYVEYEEDEVSSKDMVEKVKRIIIDNLSDGNLQREELASAVHISPGYLTRIFKKETGMALSDYIIEKRIAVAKQLLEKTNLSITVIADKVGISYSSYFTKLFKEKVGISPIEYRQNAKENSKK